MSKRIDRANSEILRCITDIIHNKMNDPRIDDFVMISEVNVSNDFSYLKVKISLLQQDYSKADLIINILKKSEGFIKRELANMVRMPQVPHIVFEFDKGVMNELRVEELLKTINIPKE